ALLVVRGDVAREPGLRRGRRGLEEDRPRRAEVRRAPAGEPVGRRAVHEPDRRVGHAAARRGRAAGGGAGGRAPGAEREERPRPRVRRRRAVFRDVDRELRALSMAEPAVLYEKRDGVAVVTMNRPEVRSAINPEMLCRLADAWQDVQDDPNVLAAIFTGAGEQA